MVLPRWRLLWFALSLSIVVGVMMMTYVAVPARLIGMKTTYSKRDKLTATAVGGAVGAVVCAPPYLLGRVGLLMLGSDALFIPGVILLAIGLTLLPRHRRGQGYQHERQAGRRESPGGIARGPVAVARVIGEDQPA